MIDVTITQAGHLVCTATVATEAEAHALQDRYARSWMVLRPQTSWVDVWAEEARTTQAAPQGA